MGGVAFFEALDAFPHASLDQLAGAGGLVVVSPHPDDETLGCGGLIAQACAEGRRVKVAIVSDGAMSHRSSLKYPPERMAALRRQEAVAALQALGLDPGDLHFLEARDGQVPAEGRESTALSQAILSLARAIDASALFTTWRSDPHRDHRACYAIARRVADWAPAVRLLEYPIWGGHGAEAALDPQAAGWRLEIGSQVDRKRAALAAYPSQVLDMVDDDPAGPLPEAMIERALRRYEVFIGQPHAPGPHQITRRLHQVMLTDAGGTPERLPRFVSDNAARLRALYPAAEYRLWDMTALRETIAEHFEPAVLDAFETLSAYAHKADLARYCLLYAFGGLYVDLSMHSLKEIEVPHGIGVASFRDYDLLSPSWTAIAIGLIWAVPGRREFRIAIDYIVENCRTRYYGANPLYPTGPVLFGRALAAAMAERRQGEDADDQWIGVGRPLTPDARRKNIAYVCPDQSVIAVLDKDIGGDLTHLGAVGTNNYNTIWRDRTVYGEAIRTWFFDDPAIRLTDQAKRTDRGIAARAGAEGILTFGPYIDMEPGRYRLTVIFDRPIPLATVIVEVAHGAGAGGLPVERIAEADAGSAIEVGFEVPERLSSVEFRTQLTGPMTAEIREFRLEPLDALARRSATFRP